MRLLILAAASATALAACGPQTETAEAPAAEAPAADPAPAADHAGHAMPGMDDTMTASDSADDANTAETPNDFTFHTYPNKVESVHLPVSEGGTWTATTAHGTLVSIGAGVDETMPDGTVHHVVKVSTLASGNAVVTFERRTSADASQPAAETRIVNFMIH
jgi:hypothetical protein